MFAVARRLGCTIKYGGSVSRKLLLISKLFPRVVGIYSIDSCGYSSLWRGELWLVRDDVEILGIME